MHEHKLTVSWGDCDLAGIAYFPRLLDFCHRAIESLFGALSGGYAGLTVTRRIGVPTVKILGDFTAPLRYGDVVCVRVEVVRIGTSSVLFEHTLVREEDQVVCARFEHTVVVCELNDRKPSPCAIPPDVASLLNSHRRLS
ncbi:MAG: hotdog domain-containing protein [Deltaproteobacteria bacterium]|nr:hotdog domain-containing protein [Deltaproteobacteria bacterium]